MPAYNFMERFSPLVESGKKRQTIRRTSKGAKVGDTAYLYTGQRTKHCRKLGEGVITDVRAVTIGREKHGKAYAIIAMQRFPENEWTRIATGATLNALARADGFANGDEMVAWFEDKYGLPFDGYLIQWELKDIDK